MANFPPLKQYILFCLDRLSQNIPLESPFLDVGCGVGDVSLHLAQNGMKGKAIDLSEAAVLNAQATLKGREVVAERKTLAEENGSYKTVLLIDVLEHLSDDAGALLQAARLLSPKGKLVLTLPSNPREWRWDDDFYGHIRRYSAGTIRRKLKEAGFEPLIIWDFTFPFFWLMRRVYTLVQKHPASENESAHAKTIKSSQRNAWKTSATGDWFSRNDFLWRWVYFIQFYLFRMFPALGHEIIVLAQKNDIENAKAFHGTEVGS